MKKKILLFSLVAMLCMTLFTNNAYAHYDNAYWHEEKQAVADDIYYKDWMSKINDDTLLSNVSLLGTHDSMAYKSDLPFSSIVRTQTMNLNQQLNSGIRYFDIRLNYENEEKFTIYHGSVNLGFSFDEVLDTLKDFLNHHPKEVVVMRVKQENSSVSDFEMWGTFNKYAYKKYPNLFWDRSKSNTDNPKIGDIRGKIVVLADIWKLSQGIDYRNLPKQDNYNISNLAGLYGKWESIKTQLNNKSFESITLNYLNGSGGVYPYFAESGHITSSTDGSRLTTGLMGPAFKNTFVDFPRSSSSVLFQSILYEGMNTLTADYITKYNLKNTGIIVSDFPGKRLIDAVIQANFR